MYRVRLSEPFAGASPRGRGLWEALAGRVDSRRFPFTLEGCM